MYTIVESTRFRRDVKLCRKRGKDMEKFKAIHTLLVHGKAPPAKYRNHALIGNWKGNRECHIEPDWLLIYRVLEEEKILEYVRMGNHADLFE